MDQSAELEPNVLRELLEPLLEDFRYWFQRAHDLLSQERLEFMTDADQSRLLERVTQAQKEVATATILFKVTGHQVGVDVAALMPWHHLLMECQAVGMRYRRQTPTDPLK
ncbi:MAG: DUF2605 domain-containing protein [Oscillatoriales cyanobacterium SM2_2_1]|nr:DUF2605 domain-containing protein [Oscillatoriales cyanobacterium SM2_2_1]